MPDEKETNQVVLESGVYEYGHVSPFKLLAVARNARAHYIENELDGVEPKPPTYTITLGGGKTPDGQPLPTWEQAYDYTHEFINELRVEYNKLRVEHNEHDPRAVIPPAIQARLIDLHSALDGWDAYVKVASELGNAILYKKRNAGFWLMFRQYMPGGDEWLEEQVVIGVDISEVSDDEQGRFVYWLETELVSTKEEYQRLVDIVEGRELEKSEARRLARDIFQHSVGES